MSKCHGCQIPRNIISISFDFIKAWWRHLMDTFSVLLEFTSHRWIPLTKASDVKLSMIWAWSNGWVNNGDAGDLRHHHAHYDVTVMGNVFQNVCEAIIFTMDQLSPLWQTEDIELQKPCIQLSPTTHDWPDQSNHFLYYYLCARLHPWRYGCYKQHWQHRMHQYIDDSVRHIGIRHGTEIFWETYGSFCK